MTPELKSVIERLRGLRDQVYSRQMWDDIVAVCDAAEAAEVRCIELHDETVLLSESLAASQAKCRELEEKMSTVTDERDIYFRQLGDHKMALATLEARVKRLYGQEKLKLVERIAELEAELTEKLGNAAVEIAHYKTELKRQGYATAT